MGNILNFTDLIVWQEGHKLVLCVYLLTKSLPDSEKFGLTSQAQRASVSITSNIAEGFGRRGDKEKIQFYYISHGSLTELHNLLLVMKDTHLITIETYSEAFQIIENVNKLLLGLIRSIKSQP